MTMEKKMDIIIEKLAAIESRLERMEKDLKALKTSCKGMDTHIGFIEDVYGTVRYPLDFITRKVSFLSGSEHAPLPLSIT